MVAGRLECPCRVEGGAQDSFKLGESARYVSGIDEHFGEVETRDRIGGRKLYGPREICASAPVASAEQSRQLVFEARKNAQRPGGVIGRIDAGRALKRAFGAQRQSEGLERARRLRLKRKIDAEPEMALDAKRTSARGKRTGRRAARMKPARFTLAPLFLSQKKECAAKSPTNLELIMGRDRFKKLNAGAHIFYLRARRVERIGPRRDV